MKKIATLVVCLCAMLTAAAQSPAGTQTPEYQAELNKVLELQNSRGTAVKTFEEAFSSLAKQGILAQDKVSAMSAELAAALYPRIESEVKKLYCENFTLDELKQIAAWVGSPTGQKMVNLTAKTASVTQEMMQSPEVQKEVMTIVSKYMK